MSFSLWVIGSLAVGIAGTVTAFTFLNAVLFRPFPGVTAQEELVKINFTRRCDRPGCVVYSSTLADYHALRDGMTTLTGLTAQATDSVAVTIDGRAHSLRGAMVSANYFDVLGVTPVVGRAFVQQATAPESDVVVIAHSLWLREFGGSSDVLGKFVDLAGVGSARIVGVAPRDFVGLSRSDVGILETGIEIWMPIRLALRVFPPLRAPESGPLRDDERYFRYIGRLAEGSTRATAQSQATVIASGIEAAQPVERAGAMAEVTGVRLTNRQLWVQLIAVVLSVPALVLLIACVNASNLLLARGTRRTRELAVRLALGATRWRIVRQLLTESVLLSLISAAAALPIGAWSMSFVTTYIRLPMPIDYRVIGFAVVIALLSAIGFSLVPALRLTAMAPGAALGSSRPGDHGPGHSRARRILVVAQVALSLGLLATGAQLISFVPAQAQTAGTPPDRLLMASFDLAQLRINRADADAFYQRLLERAAALPETDGAGLARKTAVWTLGRGMTQSAVVVWRPEDAPQDGTVSLGGYAGGELFRALGLRVLQGRAFSGDDYGQRPRVAILNRPLAMKLFGGNAVGRTVRIGAYRRPFNDSIELTIVGVVEPALEPSYRSEPGPAAYVPVPLSAETALTLYARARHSPQALAAGIRDAATAVDNRVPPIEIRSLAEITEQRQFLGRLTAQGVSVLGILGLLLATAGLYGVMSYLVSLRAREIGVRLALGAAPSSILRMTLREGMLLVLWGAAIGGLGAFVTTRIVQSEMHGVAGFDAASYAGSFLLLALTMLLASGIPARRASRVDPITVLRQE